MPSSNGSARRSVQPLEVMLPHALIAASRAIQVFAYIVLWLWLSNRAFPSNWFALGILFVALIPVALLYRWLTEHRSKPGAAQYFFPVPKYVAIAVGTIIALIGYFTHQTAINSWLYSNAG